MDLKHVDLKFNPTDDMGRCPDGLSFYMPPIDRTVSICLRILMPSELYMCLILWFLLGSSFGEISRNFSGWIRITSRDPDLSWQHLTPDSVLLQLAAQFDPPPIPTDPAFAGVGRPRSLLFIKDERLTLQNA